MAAQLWFLRHGEAEPHDVRPDAERRLTPRGEAQSRAAGMALQQIHVSFAHVFTSPKVRARDTAALAVEAGLGGEVVQHEGLIGLDREEALELAALAGPDARVLLVGHEPDFSQTVYDLTGGRVDVKKGGLVGVRLNGSPGLNDLLVLLRPREIAVIAGVALP